ncbi:MAG: DNA alkylation repair protein [Bacteroidales bacterium]|nr:DNA alkylation repair protein [Bacteroidales bacterium]
MVRIRESLFAQQDLAYRDFHSKLMPGIDIERIIGIRTPQLRKTAKDFAKDAEIDDFLSSLPHQYYDENNLHGFIIAEMKDYDRTIAEIDRLLPYIDNWATCDLIRPKSFSKNHDKLIKDIRRWMKSSKTYTIRFGIEMLMTHFLDDDFRPEYLEWVASVTNDEYYVKMMVAWYFATALAKQYDATLPIIEQKCLAPWTHNKTIQKAIESYRITDEQKEYLKGLKI